ncbi:hypothetical protein MPLSOD_280022 [Mesorhizobium sp. SOD10]|nr:hypothetical protein MPLSOD_280022 [Mesorhizobium sp. SOD10]
MVPGEPTPLWLNERGRQDGTQFGYSGRLGPKASWMSYIRIPKGERRRQAGNPKRCIRPAKCNRPSIPRSHR